jgi:hypothetical protein
MAPKANERFLNDILSVRGRTRPLPRKQKQSRAVLTQPMCPGFMVARFLHSGAIVEFVSVHESVAVVRICLQN